MLTDLEKKGEEEEEEEEEEERGLSNKCEREHG